MVFVEQSLASPYGRGAPNGGGEGPLSHGCAVTAPPKGEPRSLPDKHQFTEQLSKADMHNILYHITIFFYKISAQFPSDYQEKCLNE